MTEHRETFACFGSECTVIVAGGTGAAAAVADARRRLLDWHVQFSRFEPDSELSRLNADPRASVPVSSMLRRIIQSGIDAARATEGLVDPTLVREIEQAGYDAHLEAGGRPLSEALALAPPRSPGRAHPERRWAQIRVERGAGTITRPRGVMFDPGGIAKGVFADELAARLSGHDAFVVDCGGDMRLGGRVGVKRKVHVASPSGGSILHTLQIRAGAVATSGIGKRSWLDQDGRPAHHLLNPATGRPAFTGVVQVTAVARTAVEAESLSKAVLLSGPAAAERMLERGGGVVVLDDGTVKVVAPARPSMPDRAPRSAPPTRSRRRRAPAAAQAR